MPAPALSLRGLRKTFGDVVAVNDLDLEVLPGECFGLLGPNGAGKTTTIEICEGLTAPDAGEVLVLGQQWGQGGAALRERLGISLQETQFSEKLTVAETLQLFRSFYHRPRPLDHVLAAVQLGEKRNGRVGQLSGGQKQRLALACALVADPELFFLDEPTTGLDPQSRRQLWELIEGVKRAGRTVVITTHYMEEAERLCDRVAIVDHGRVIALGRPRDLVATLGAQHVIEFSLGDELPPDLSAAQPSVGEADLLALDGALSIRRREDSYLLESAQAHRTVPALLELLRARGLPLAQLRTHSATLEDVFVHLTGRTLRDG
ncbi:MAG TPA: ABC transporter ATP-binding protein [Gemmatimonadales bacterium]|nr:ABC transporter ATP-binding protein [Gemmatimonadales bacterium]